MLELMGCTNAQLGLLNTVSSTISLALFLVGPYLADKLDAKRVITFAIGGLTVLTFIFAMFVSLTYRSHHLGSPANRKMPYWACLIKYINNLGGEGEQEAALVLTTSSTVFRERSETLFRLLFQDPSASRARWLHLAL